MRSPKLRRPGRSLLLRDRAPEPETVPMDSYPYPATDAAGWLAAPAAPARTRQGTYGEWTGTMTVNNEPASAAAHMDDRCRKAHTWCDLKTAYFEDEGMGYRLDDAAQLRERGEKLDGRTVVARAAREGTAHLLGPRADWHTRNSGRPWAPAGGWDHGWARGLNWYRPEDGDTGLPYWRPPTPQDKTERAARPKPQPWWVPEDPSGVRAAYEQAFNGNGAA